ncbi:hypothetical protein DFQ30_003091 [Apophysomyces sp. BC1015]|nr:hypothetical protein DFQ30_003091 [Apophysomyces sp. BC1015]
MDYMFEPGNAALSSGEIRRRRDAWRIDLAQAVAMVVDNDDHLECQSFSDESVWYEVQYENINGEELLTACECPDHQGRGLICKHMFLVSRVVGIAYFPTETQSSSSSIQEVCDSVRLNDLRDEFREHFHTCAWLVNAVVRTEDCSLLESGIQQLKNLASYLEARIDDV